MGQRCEKVGQEKGSGMGQSGTGTEMGLRLGQD